jgi:hypothetical protein
MNYYAKEPNQIQREEQGRERKKPREYRRPRHIYPFPKQMPMNDAAQRYNQNGRPSYRRRRTFIPDRLIYLLLYDTRTIMRTAVSTSSAEPSNFVRFAHENNR